MNNGKISLPDEIADFDYQSKVGYAALRAFFRVTSEWNCTVAEESRLLGDVGIIKLEEYRALPAAALDRMMLLRIRCFVMIYRATVYQHGSISKANREVRISRYGAPFMGLSPLKHIMNNGVVGLLEACKFYAGELPRQASEAEVA